jgi:glycosyltransferase involved in cell wall biosynthesis
VSNAQLAWCYQRADVLWYPSASEGFGYPPLEARMLGCPVLAANGHAVAELAGDDPGVITAEQPQARWLSEASQSLLGDSIPIRRDICSRFGVESYRNALAALYEQR